MFDPKIAIKQSDQLNNILVVYGLSWFWVMIIVTILNGLFADAEIVANVFSQPPIFSALPYLINDYLPILGTTLSQNTFLSVFLIVIFAPVFEEILFRLLPLTIFENFGPRVLLAVQLGFCGVLFGLVHGHWSNVFIQGGLGFMLGRLYMANSKSMFSSWASCAIVHAMYNLTVILVWGIPA